MMEIKPGDFVSKKSRKPFQNGEKIAKVESMTTMTIKERDFVSVNLEGCKGSVQVRILHLVE